MKKLTLITLMSLSFMGCKKDVQAPTPPPAGPCHCGEVLQANLSNTTIAVKNNCSGNILYFDISLTTFMNVVIGEQYCSWQSW
jgi:hypothetical protein